MIVVLKNVFLDVLHTQIDLHLLEIDFNKYYITVAILFYNMIANMVSNIVLKNNIVFIYQNSVK